MAAEAHFAVVGAAAGHEGHIEFVLAAELGAPDASLGGADGLGDLGGDVPAVALPEELEPGAIPDEEVHLLGGRAGLELVSVGGELEREAAGELLGGVGVAGEQLPRLAGLDLGEHLPDAPVELERVLEVVGLLGHHEPEAVNRVVGAAEILDEDSVLVGHGQLVVSYRLRRRRGGSCRRGRGEQKDGPPADAGGPFRWGSVRAGREGSRQRTRSCLKSRGASVAPGAAAGASMLSPGGAISGAAGIIMGTGSEPAKRMVVCLLYSAPWMREV